MKTPIVQTIFLALMLNGCDAQIKSEKMTTKNNPLLCDPATGICEIPSVTGGDSVTGVSTTVTKPIKVVYFTDPICSSCWGIEPQLRKLKLEYGNALEIEYRMGGLLPDWSYNSGGISKPSDVAHHWDEVSVHYDMPIDGDVWLEDPLQSSYPPSIAFKAAQLQDEQKAIKFLRVIREMVFLKKKNITKWEHIATAAEAVGLDANRMKADMRGKANELFEEDLKLSRSMGVRGFPTIFFANESGQQRMVYGSKSYDEYEAAIANLNNSVKKESYPHEWKALFSYYPTLTSREFAELSGISRKDADTYLQQLQKEGQLTKLDTKNGPLWMVKAGS